MLKRFSNCRAILAALAATAALGVSAAHATTYYVSSSGGNDGNNGTSTSTPWQTTAKVNGFALNPGDQVLFKRGDNWYSQLAPTRSGVQGNSITFADYGTGNKPTLWGSNPVPNASFSPAGTNEWSAQVNVGAAVTGVIVNGYVAPNGAWLVSGNPATPGFFSYSGTTLTIYSTTDPRTDGKTYTADSREDIILSNGQSHLVFTNLIAREATHPDEGYVIRIENSADVILNSCEAYCGSKHLYGFINATGVVANNCDAQYGLPHNEASGCTFYVSYADQSGPFSGCTSVYNSCSGENFQNGDGGAYQYFVCHGPNQGPITFNNPQDNGGLFSVLEDGGVVQPVTITGGTITDNDLEVFAHDMITTGVTFLGNASVDNYGANNVYQNCKFINIKQPGGGISGFWTAFLMRSVSTNAILRFNTVVMDPSTGNGTTCLAMQAHGSATQSYGNIFMSNTGKVINVWAAGSSSPPNNTDVTNSDYNWYQSSPTPIFDFDGISFATWKADTGADAHTLTGNPIFANPAGGDYTLANTSPALNTVNITTETPALPATDFAGNPRKFGAAYDPGAYELQQNQQSPSAPVITSAGSATGTTGSAFSYQITASNFPASYGASPLPSGTSVNTGTGLISGTPNTAGVTNTTVSATNSGGTGTKVVAITINLAAPVITSGGTASGYAGSSFSYQITASGSPTSYGATPLPAGVSVNTGTGLISGTPTSAGTTNATVSATNSAGTGTKTVVITISNVSTLYNINAINTTGTAPANGGLDSFNSAYASSELGTSVTFNGSAFTFGPANNKDAFNNEVVPLPAGTYATLNMVGTASGGIATSQTFTVNYSDGTHSTFTVNMSDWTTAAGLAGETKVVNMPDFINSSGALTAGHHYLSGWTLTLTGHAVASITLPTSRGVVMLGFAAGGAVSAPVITSSTSASGNVGTAFSYQITATNSPTSYGGSSLPAGTSVNTSTGLISGTPTTAATYNSTVTATNAGGTGSQAVTITITNTPPPAPVINSALTKSGTVGTALSYNITATNSPTSYNATPLPAGLSVNTGTGAITGTPTTQGISNTTISATNAGGTGSATLVFTISSPATAYNVFAYFTLGTTVTNGGVDSFSSAYESNLMPSSTTFNGSTFTYAAANVADAWSNVTVNLPPGSYTTLDMLATSTGGNVTAKTFTVNYTDGTNSVFTQSLHDWTSSSVYAGETTVVTMANRLNSSGQVTTPAVYFKGYTFTLNGKSVQSITLPASRQVVAFGFAGH